LGFFEEDRDDETRMTDEFERLRVRNFCTETSYVEHIGRGLSILDQWRQTPVGRRTAFAIHPVPSGWPPSLQKFGSINYYRHIKPSVSLGEHVSSTLLLDVVIPVAVKDSEMLPHTIAGVRENLRHPLGRIVVVAPDDPAIRRYCSECGVEFVCEEGVLPIRRQDIDYRAGGLDRSGWLFQQFIKWTADSLATEERYLILDSDTVLICPQVFEVGGRIVLLHSDEYHRPYFDVYRRLLGVDAPCELSFTSHQMVYSKARIRELRAHIEATHDGKPWYSVILDLIDRSQNAAVSDYETYGQWMLQNHEEEITREYWFNVALDRSQIAELPRLRRELYSRYRSISFHKHVPDPIG
jgi:hypothetical protein